MKEFTPEEMVDIFRAIGFNVIELDQGSVVLCDLCNADHTLSSESGGLLFGSHAVCPACAPKIESAAKEHGEEEYIRARCPEGKSFANWVRADLRGAGGLN